MVMAVSICQSNAQKQSHIVPLHSNNNCVPRANSPLPWIQCRTTL